jgi:hypothetical protein
MTLAPGTANIQKLLDGKASLTDVLDALLAAEAATTPAPTEAPERKPLPAVVPLSDPERTTLRTLVNKIDALDLPTTARELSAAERTQFIAAFDQIKDGLKAIKRAEDALKEVFQNHLDVELGTPGPDVEQDANGHYVAAGSVTGDGLAKRVSREVRGGKAVSLTVDDLSGLEADGDITHADFLAMTDAVRVVDEAAIMKILNGRPELLPVFRKVARVAPAGTSIYIRPVK